MEADTLALLGVLVVLLSLVGIALFSRLVVIALLGTQLLMFVFLLAGFGFLRSPRSSASGPPVTSHFAEVSRVVGCFHTVLCCAHLRLFVGSHVVHFLHGPSSFV